MFPQEELERRLGVAHYGQRWLGPSRKEGPDGFVGRCHPSWYMQRRLKLLTRQSVRIGGHRTRSSRTKL